MSDTRKIIETAMLNFMQAVHRETMVLAKIIYDVGDDDKEQIAQITSVVAGQTALALLLAPTKETYQNVAQSIAGTAALTFNYVVESDEDK